MSDTGLNVVHVDDVAEGHWLALTYGKIGERYILGGDDMGLGEILSFIAQQTGGHPPFAKIPRELIYPFAYAAETLAKFTHKEPFATIDALRMAKKKMYFSSAKAKRDLGYTPRSAAGRPDRRDQLVPRERLLLKANRCSILIFSPHPSPLAHGFIWPQRIVNFWQPLIDATEEKAPAQWPSVDIIVPARNEAESLPQSLPSLLAQKYEGNWRIILVDDHSKDGTTDVARKLALDAQKTDKLLIVQAPELPAGWAGKVAAMKAGVDQSQSAYILFTDADIEHPADSLKHLVATSLAQELDLYSQMVKLHCQTQAEKLLIPAFIFFFSLLYPVPPRQ